MTATTMKFHYTNLEDAMYVLCRQFASDIEQPWTGFDQYGEPYSTVADTADCSSNAAPVDAATIRASVVLPVPGGP